MSTQAKAVAAPSGPRSREARRLKARKRKLYGQLLARAREEGLTPRVEGPLPEEVLQQSLGRAVSHMLYAASETDKLDEDEFWVHKVDAQGNLLVEPNKWYQLEERCRREVTDMAAKMTELGLAERLVRIEEAQAEVIVRALVSAARKPDIPPSKIKQLGPAIRESLATIEGTAREKVPA